jgi:hypothetical protein
MDRVVVFDEHANVIGISGDFRVFIDANSFCRLSLPDQALCFDWHSPFLLRKEKPL